MATIDVQRSGHDEYTVSVSAGGSATSHVVTAVDAAAGRHATTSKELVAASFRFLLDREPKEAILSRFDLGVITSYFPEYESAIDGYLRG